MKRLLLLPVLVFALTGCGLDASMEDQMPQNQEAADTRTYTPAPVLVKESEAYQYINNKGEVAIEGPFQEADYFSEGLARVSTEEGSYMINEKGKKQFDLKYELAEPFSDERGLIEVTAGNDQGFPRYGYINKKGSITINPIYYTATSFSENKAFGLFANNAENEDGWTVHLLNKSGETKEIEGLRVGNTTYMLPYSEGRAVIMPNQYAHAYLLDEKGQIISRGIYNEISSFHNGLAPAMKETDNGEQKWGYIDRDGNEVIPFEYTEASEFGENAAFVQQDGLWGIIDRKGKWIQAPVYDDAYAFSEGLGAVNTGGLWGFVDEKGNMAIPAQFADAGLFQSGLAQVFVGETNAAYINSKGEYVIEPDGYAALRLEEAGTDDKTQHAVSEEEAVQRIRTLLAIENQDEYFVEIDHLDEGSNYVIHAYGLTILDEETGEGHSFTLGYYVVNPSTGEVRDFFTGETISEYKPDYSTETEGYILFNGGDFTAEFPEEYDAYPSYSYNDESFRMLTVDPGENIHFFVYSGSEDDTPDDFIVNESFETLTEKEKDYGDVGQVIRYRIDADDGSYIKTFEQTLYKDGSQIIVGLMFDSWDTYNQYKSQYLDFKKSVKKR
ncbi:WG repeat-containing protein [Domibacillus epiphyticus]|uniref:WG repeat-containing protein n=1 Tax=Domibacillus epiphyticus TaxID=1714355 RepID=A0A1V2A6N6_9BACI|nr:WG repeat-containing protein [Domibacillus epiphyticus]OMP66649.1 hypothetical protein BTO28_11440 [Domibacillus epiphyticus]